MPSSRLVTVLALALSPCLAASAVCTPTATAMCLNHDRFMVEARWTTPDGQSGTARAVKVTEDTGYLWFFNPSNVELVVKVLDGCGIDHRYWVFAGGLTNVAVELSVSDTQEGDVSNYFSSQNSPFSPIQDTDAFATCP